MVAPTLWCGMAEHHMAFGGTFTFDIPTYMAVLRAFLTSIKRHGFKRVFIVNGHGGNIAALNAFLPDFTRETGLKLYATTYFELSKDDLAQFLEDQKSGAPRLRGRDLDDDGGGARHREARPPPRGVRHCSTAIRARHFPRTRYRLVQGADAERRGRRCAPRQADRRARSCSRCAQEGLAATLKNREMWG